MKRIAILCASAALLAACGPTTSNTTSSSSSNAAASVGSSAAASSAPAGALQVANSFGLIGRWALDCGQPASQDNEYSVYSAAPDGSISLTYDNGPDAQQNQYTFSAAQLVGDDQIQMDGVFLGDGLAQHTTMRKNSQGQIKVWRNVDSSGKVLVDNGEFPDGGGPTWDNKCS